MAKLLLYMVYRNGNQKAVRKEIIRKKVSFEAIPKNKSALEVRQHGGRLFQRQEMHDHRQQTALYIGSLAVRITMTIDDMGAFLA